LLTDVVPAFAAVIAKLSPLELQHKSYSLTNELHRSGINCRYLGHVRRALPPSSNNFKQQFLLNEIAARACKNMLQSSCESFMAFSLWTLLPDTFCRWRSKLAQLKTPSSEPYLEVAVEFFNRILQNTDRFWNGPEMIKSVIQTCFHAALTDNELLDSYDLRKSLDLTSVIRDLFILQSFAFIRFSCIQVIIRLEQCAKVKLTSRIRELLQTAPKKESIRILKVDVKNVSCGLKQLPLMNLSEGKLLILQAQEGDTSQAQMERLFRMANERFAKGIHPCHSFTWLGSSFSTAAIAANVNDSEILFSWATSLVSESAVADAKPARLLMSAWILGLIVYLSSLTRAYPRKEALTKLNRCVELSHPDAPFSRLTALVLSAAYSSDPAESYGALLEARKAVRSTKWNNIYINQADTFYRNIAAVVPLDRVPPSFFDAIMVRNMLFLFWRSSFILYLAW